MGGFRCAGTRLTSRPGHRPAMRWAVAALVAVLLVTPAVTAGPWIDRVHPRTPSGWDTEFVVVRNRGGSVDLTGWRLDDGEGRVELRGPLGPGGTLLAVEDPDAYRRWNLSIPARHLVFGPSFKLANGGDEVRLVDPDGDVVDAVAYGGGRLEADWRGPPVARPAIGEVLVRRGRDTDRAGDFDGLRRYRFGQTEAHLPWYAGADVTLFAAPDASHDVVRRFIRDADRSLQINAYRFTHVGLAEEVLAARDRGVEVTLILEGGPVGVNFTVQQPDPHLDPVRWRMWRDANRQTWIADRIRQAGGTVVTIDNGRYRFDHAKYALADGNRTLVMTENWGFTGLPADPSFGNRGFGAVVDHPGVAADLASVFSLDADTRRPDVAPHRRRPDPAFRSGYGTPTGDHRPRFDPATVPGAAVRPLLSPDEAGDLLDVLALARDRIDLWALDLAPVWGADAPLLDALVTARDRGAKVRVLVNDNPRYDPDQVERVAARLSPHGIEVAGLRAGEPFANLHAKAAVVDDAFYLGSMNFNDNAFTNNRELGVVVADPDAADWAADVFADDWDRARRAEAAPGGLDEAWWALAGGVAVGAGLGWYVRRARGT